jgi:hypothetical protein
MKMCGAVPPLPHTPSWRGAQLSIGIVPYFTLLQLELTPWNRVLLEKIITTQLDKKFPPFMDPESS